MHEFLIKLDSFDCITFKNKNTLDYRKDNLFGVSHGVKVSRRRKVKITTRGNIPTSKYKGVCIRRRNGIIVWEARVSKDDKTYYLGSYTSQRDAGRAYNEKARELYGEFAYQNKV